MQQAFQIAPRPIERASKPERNEAYKRFVKRFACAACGGARLVDPAHCGAHGLGQKSSDRTCIPLCRKCHDLFDADPRGFAAEHGLDVPGLIRGFNERWEETQRKRA